MHGDGSGERLRKRRCRLTAGHQSQTILPTAALPASGRHKGIISADRRPQARGTPVGCKYHSVPTQRHGQSALSATKIRNIFHTPHLSQPFLYFKYMICNSGLSSGTVWRRGQRGEASKPAERTAARRAAGSWEPATVAMPVVRLTSTCVTPGTAAMLLVTAA